MTQKLKTTKERELSVDQKIRKKGKQCDFYRYYSVQSNQGDCLLTVLLLQNQHLDPENAAERAQTLVCPERVEC